MMTRIRLQSAAICATLMSVLWIRQVRCILIFFNEEVFLMYQTLAHSIILYILFKEHLKNLLLCKY